MITDIYIEADTWAEAVQDIEKFKATFNNKCRVSMKVSPPIEEPVGYAFNWLKNNKAQEETNMANKVGAIEYDVITDMTKLPQRIASAASAIENAGLAGASYKPIIYFGAQIVHGVKYWFFAEQTLITNPPQKRIVKMAVIEVQGKFEIVKDSIKVIHNIE